MSGSVRTVWYITQPNQIGCYSLWHISMVKTMSSLTSVDIADLVIQLSDTIKVLGVTLDSSLTISPHTKALSKGQC